MLAVNACSVYLFCGLISLLVLVLVLALAFHAASRCLMKRNKNGETDLGIKRLTTKRKFFMIPTGSFSCQSLFQCVSVYLCLFVWYSLARLSSIWAIEHKEGEGMQNSSASIYFCLVFVSS